MDLVSYKMTHDSGFAPNPFHGYRTLATCKPGIRRSGNRRVGDLVAGFTSGALCGDAVGRERLVYPKSSWGWFWLGALLGLGEESWHLRSAELVGMSRV